MPFRIKPLGRFVVKIVKKQYTIAKPLKKQMGGFLNLKQCKNFLK